MKWLLSVFFSRQRCQIRRDPIVHAYLARIALLVLIVFSIGFLSACSKTAEGKILGAYQPLRSGRVQMFIEVQLNDGTKVSVWLPEDQKIWDKASSGSQRRVKLRRKISKKYWEFVGFLGD